MPSSLSWLDTSAEAQRRAREIVALFRQSESRDELGLGQIRDAISDALFPGISVIQQRARYFLFVPWLFKAGERAGMEGAPLLRWVHGHERRHIGWMRDHLADEGLIGRRAGARVKILPSTIYWSGLIRYGILSRAVSPDQLRRVPPARTEQDAEAEDRPLSSWIPAIPEPPTGFPSVPPDTLALRRGEAAWLRERILDAAPGTLLTHLLRGDQRPAPLAVGPFAVDPGAAGPWRDPACLGADGEPRAWLHHAELFAVTLHGAALLFNLLIAERYRDAGLTRIEAPIAGYEERLAAWWAEVAGLRIRLSTWDRADLWRRVRLANPRLSALTTSFVDAWVQAVLAAAGPDTPGLRTLVADRERRVKQAQSRLVNDRLLRTWSGASGAAAITFRWGQACTMINDIRTGLDSESAVDALA